ncbi:hypothetical protein NL676_029495 [Syzygium grande]|nr:hypothetical protein NL676_029495 [Syzygium grande]
MSPPPLHSFRPPRPIVFRFPSSPPPRDSIHDRTPSRQPQSLGRSHCAATPPCRKWRSSGPASPENGVLPDNFMVPNSLKACGTLMWIGFDKGVRGYVGKMGLGGCVSVASSVIDFYGKWRLSWGRTEGV